MPTLEIKHSPAPSLPAYLPQVARMRPSNFVVSSRDSQGCKPFLHRLSLGSGPYTTTQLYMQRLNWVPGLILRAHLHTRCSVLRSALAGAPKQAPVSAHSAVQAPARGVEGACLGWARQMSSRRGGRGGGARGRGRGGIAPGQRPVSETQRISIADQLSNFQRSDQTGAPPRLRFAAVSC